MSVNLSKPQMGRNSLRWHTIRTIAAQQPRDTLFGWGIYITAAASVGIAALQIFNSVRFVGESSLNIVPQPFLLPLQAALSLAILFVAVEATLAIARPREQGSLQILFFAPIDEPMLIGGNFLAGLLVYILFVSVTLPILLLLAWITNYVIPINLLWAIIPTIFAVSVTIAFGPVCVGGSTLSPSCSPDFSGCYTHFAGAAVSVCRFVEYSTYQPLFRRLPVYPHHFGKSTNDFVMDFSIPNAGCYSYGFFE